MLNEMIRAEIWLHDNLHSEQGIEDLANRLGYSTSQVRRRFKHLFGLSPSAYRDTLRLEKAARLLTFTPLPIQTIAAHCGYQNHSAFSRAFQRYHKQPPRQYRLALRLKLRRNAYCQKPSEKPPAFEIRMEPAFKILAARLYQEAQSHSGDLLQHWTQYATGADNLPSRLCSRPIIALMYNTPLPSANERIDIGPQISPQEAQGMAIPASFRLLTLPAQRYACVELESLDELQQVIQYLVCCGLPEKQLHANGEAVQVERYNDRIRARLPLQG